MHITEERKQIYINDVRLALIRRGIPSDDIPRVVAKTGFLQALNEYPEEQFHYDPSDAADEILSVAARA